MTKKTSGFGSLFEYAFGLRERGGPRPYRNPISYIYSIIEEDDRDGTVGGRLQSFMDKSKTKYLFYKERKYRKEGRDCTSRLPSHSNRTKDIFGSKP